MSNNAQKTPFTSTQNAFATRKAQQAIDILGKSLPCSVVSIPTPGVPIVTVKFEIQDTTFPTIPNVTVPVLGSEYVRLPLRTAPGTKGVVIALDAYIGGVSGLGGGVADLSQRGNLATLAFVPIGNKAWKAVDPDILTLYGASSSLIQDTVDNASSIAVTPTAITASAVNGGSTLALTDSAVTTTVGGAKVTVTNSAITLTCSGHTLTINSSGIALDGKLFAPHTHTGVQSGTGVTGPVS